MRRAVGAETFSFTSVGLRQKCIQTAEGQILLKPEVQSRLTNLFLGNGLRSGPPLGYYPAFLMICIFWRSREFDVDFGGWVLKVIGRQFYKWQGKRGKVYIFKLTMKFATRSKAKKSAIKYLFKIFLQERNKEEELNPFLIGFWLLGRIYTFSFRRLRNKDLVYCFLTKRGFWMQGIKYAFSIIRRILAISI